MPDHDSTTRPPLQQIKIIWIADIKGKMEPAVGIHLVRSYPIEALDRGIPTQPDAVGGDLLDRTTALSFP